MELHTVLLLIVHLSHISTYMHTFVFCSLAQTEVSLPFANPRLAFRMDTNIHFNFRKMFSYTIVGVICYQWACLVQE